MIFYNLLIQSILLFNVVSIKVDTFLQAVLPSFYPIFEVICWPFCKPCFCCLLYLISVIKTNAFQVFFEFWE